MKKSWKIALIIAGSAILVMIVLVWALFHGYFDRGNFEVKQMEWSSTRQVAMVAERSDNEALGGLEYFVLVADHVLSPKELRHAYYSNSIIFRTGNDCIGVHWRGPTKLVITCNGTPLDKGEISVRKQLSGSVSISYENIPMK